MRYISNDLEVLEKLLDLIFLKNTTCNCDTKEALDSVLAEHSKPVNKIMNVTTDGAPAMRGTNKNLLGF